MVSSYWSVHEIYANYSNRYFKQFFDIRSLLSARPWPNLGHAKTEDEEAVKAMRATEEGDLANLRGLRAKYVNNCLVKTKTLYLGHMWFSSKLVYFLFYRRNRSRIFPASRTQFSNNFNRIAW